MQDAVLVAALKYGFLALLALFVFFTVRTVAVTLRVPGGDQASGTASASSKPRKRSEGGGDKAPGKVPNVVIMRTGGKKVGTFKLKEQLTLGRADTCGLCPPDDYLSQFHAKFSRRDDAWFVEDLGSTNGTSLNGQELTGPMEVRSGDQVTAGTTTLELRR